MTAPLPTPTDYSSNGLRRSYRGVATSYLKSREEGMMGNSPPLEPCEQWTSPACGSPPRFRPPSSCGSNSSSSRCRSRTPSPPGDDCPSTSSSLSSKTPRSVSPGGTPASSAGLALRKSQRQPASSCEGAPTPRSVSWSTKLVTSVTTRPRTLRKDVASLFYSRADEKRFRREAEFAVPDDDWAEQLDEDSLGSLSDDEEGSEDNGDNITNSAATSSATATHKPLWQRDKRKDYAISKAVVVFGNSTKTYGGQVQVQQVPTPCSVEVALEADKASSSFSFDDAAFWNGQLTWS